VNQLPLAISGLGPANFAHFWAGTDALALARLRALAEQPGADQLLVSGATSAGKTHLLLATCEAASAKGWRVAYLPLAQIEPDALSEPLDADLIAVDDVDRALGNSTTAHWLFAQINRQHDRARALLLALPDSSDPALAVLPDLASRLASCERLPLSNPDDSARKSILLFRAEQAGIPLDPAAADHLLRHHTRDLRALLAKLAELDREALARGRRITVPLLREVR